MKNKQSSFNTTTRNNSEKCTIAKEKRAPMFLIIKGLGLAMERS
jgi:hypothetical protein